jgi:hypothetical protein
MTTAASRRDRGAVLVELAFLLPLLTLLVFGTIELGLAWVTDNRVEGAVSQAARIGASSGSREEADRDILVALRSSLPAGQLALLDRVVVFNAAAGSSSVPAGCRQAAGSTSNDGSAGCNSYSGAAVRLVSVDSMVGFGGGSGAMDSWWAPTTRNDGLADPPDYLGVWIRTRHQSLTGFGFARVTVEATSVYRIQPDLYG